MYIFVQKKYKIIKKQKCFLNLLFLISPSLILYTCLEYFYLKAILVESKTLIQKGTVTLIAANRIA